MLVQALVVTLQVLAEIEVSRVGAHLVPENVQEQTISKAAIVVLGVARRGRLANFDLKFFVAWVYWLEDPKTSFAGATDEKEIGVRTLCSVLVEMLLRFRHRWSLAEGGISNHH